MTFRSMTAALLLPAAVLAQPGPAREDVLAAMRHATTFYVDRVATDGGYHFFYAEDLSYGRSEHAEGSTQIEYQREGTPLVTLAYLDAYEATGDRLFLDAARKAGGAYLRGQLCSGGWDYFVELDPVKRKQYQYRADDNCGADRRGVTNLDDNITQSAVRVMMRLDRALGFQDAAIHSSVTSRSTSSSRRSIRLAPGRSGSPRRPITRSTPSSGPAIPAPGTARGRGLSTSSTTPSTTTRLPMPST